MADAQVLMGPFSRQEQDRFWSFVGMGGPDDCWEWRGEHDKRGKALYTRARVGYFAHRMVYALVYGSVVGPAYRSCRNLSCVNPAHVQTERPMKEGTIRMRCYTCMGQTLVWHESRRAWACGVCGESYDTDEAVRRIALHL